MPFHLYVCKLPRSKQIVPLISTSLTYTSQQLIHHHHIPHLLLYCYFIYLCVISCPIRSVVVATSLQPYFRCPFVRCSIKTVAHRDDLAAATPPSHTDWSTDSSAAIITFVYQQTRSSHSRFLYALPTSCTQLLSLFVPLIYRYLITQSCFQVFLWLKVNNFAIKFFINFRLVLSQQTQTEYCHKTNSSDSTNMNVSFCMCEKITPLLQDFWECVILGECFTVTMHFLI